MMRMTWHACALLQLDGSLLGSLCPQPGRAQPQQVSQSAQLPAQVRLRYNPVCRQLLQQHAPIGVIRPSTFLASIALSWRYWQYKHLLQHVHPAQQCVSHFFLQVLPFGGWQDMPGPGW